MQLIVQKLLPVVYLIVWLFPEHLCGTKKKKKESIYFLFQAWSHSPRCLRWLRKHNNTVGVRWHNALTSQIY